MNARLADPSRVGSLSYQFRSLRDPGLRELLLGARRQDDAICRVIDLGGRAAYWERVGKDWLEENAISVLCVNQTEAEFKRGSNDEGWISFATGNACDLREYADNSFDVVHSNSVIEHVGSWKQMCDFAHEVRRLAPAYYVQTPNFWFPIDPHFFRFPFIHWLPAPLRAKIHRRIKAGWAERASDPIEAMQLAVSNAMLGRTEMRSLFPDGHLHYERVALLPKSIIATRIDAKL